MEKSWVPIQHSPGHPSSSVLGPFWGSKITDLPTEVQASRTSPVWVAQETFGEVFQWDDFFSVQFFWGFAWFGFVGFGLVCVFVWLHCFEVGVRC